MRTRTVKAMRGLGLLLALALVAAACGEDEPAATQAPATTAAPTATQAPATQPPAAGEVVVGDLAYFTGDFGDIGDMLAAQVDFPVSIINQDPPLGIPWRVVHEDIGTVGEAQAARKLLEQDGAQILVSAAHNYLTYRDFMLDWQADNNGPLMPTVHGGAIPGNLGGVATEEPLFRAQGLDEGQGVTAAMHAESLGVTTGVLITTPTSGYQLVADAMEKALPLVGIELLERIDAPGEQASYRTEIQRAVDLAPDAIFIQGQAGESAIMVKETAEAGYSTHIIGEAGWVEPEFPQTATGEAIAFAKSVVFPGFGRQDNAAWEFYQPLWDDDPTWNQHTGAEDFYSYTTYDLMTITALAVEKAGSVDASAWAPAVFEVTEAPGTVCYNYPECVALIRAGDDIDYDGITGPGTYSGSGINAVIPAIFTYDETGAFTETSRVDAERHLEILDQVAAPFEG